MDAATAAKILELSKEYRTSMDAEVVHDWAQELVMVIRYAIDPGLKGVVL